MARQCWDKMIGRSREERREDLETLERRRKKARMKVRELIKKDKKEQKKKR